MGKKYILFLLLQVCTFFARAQYHDAALTPEQEIVSQQFISNVGGERHSHYLDLEKLILAVPADPSILPNIMSNAIGSHTTTCSEIKLMLGEPNRKVEESVFEYDLKSAPGCIACIGFNADGLVIFKTIKNCP